MTYYAVGQSTKTVYASGSKADCLRKLQRKYPSTNWKNGKVGMVLPETIELVRI